MIGALIVGYNDPTAITRLVGELRAQSKPLGLILVVDNSDRTPFESEMPGVEIVRPSRNMGVAGAFRIGMEKARSMGLEFLWVFDQDSSPGPELLSELLRLAESLRGSTVRPAILAPLPFDTSSGVELHGLNFDRYRFVLHDGRPDRDASGEWYRCDAVIASGSLVDVERTRDVELPEDGLFIDGVDWRFCSNARAKDLDVVVATASRLPHRLGNLTERAVPFRSRPLHLHFYSPNRYYFISRNHTFVELGMARSRGYYARALVNRSAALMKLILKILVFERTHAVPKVRASVRGFFDGVRGNLATPIPLRG